MSNFRRSWNRKGRRSLLKQVQRFENDYLFTAIQSLTGKSFHLMSMGSMSTQTELIFLKELKKQHPKQHVYVVIDNAPCHKPKILHTVSGLSILYLPSYSPELNPVERFFEEVRRFTADRVFTSMKALEKRLTKFIKCLTDDWVKNLTCYEWIEKCVVVN